MIGSAFPASRLLLIEQPGPWGRRGLRDSRCPTGVADAIELRAAQQGLRVQTIRRPGRSGDTDRLSWAVADTRPGHEDVSWSTFTDPAQLLEQDWCGIALGEEPPSGDGPVYLVCAHSKHDACCALRGRPVAAALNAVRPGSVWETSHLGGDRFSANVVVLPAGIVYGRVLTFALPDLVRAAEADEILTPLLRGQVGHPGAVQAALAFAYEQLGLRSRRDLRVLDWTGVHDGRAVVALAAPAGPVSVEVEVSRVAAPGLTCGNPGPNHFLRYRALELLPPAD